MSGIVEGLMVVVVRRSVSPYGHDAMVPSFILFEAEFLPMGVVDIDEQHGCAVSAVGDEPDIHSGGESERLRIVDFGKKYRRGGVRPGVGGGVAEEVSSGFGIEKHDSGGVFDEGGCTVERFCETDAVQCYVTVIESAMVGAACRVS